MFGLRWKVWSRTDLQRDQYKYESVTSGTTACFCFFFNLFSFFLIFSPQINQITFSINNISINSILIPLLSISINAFFFRVRLILPLFLSFFFPF